MLVDGAIIGTAKAAVEGVDFVVNGVPAGIAALRGQSYVFTSADAVGGLRDSASDSGPVIAFAIASSSGWLGTAIATGFVNAPPVAGVGPVLAPSVGTRVLRRQLRWQAAVPPS